MINVLTTEQVATRLGVKRETIYAYVSRGLLRRTLGDDGRSSLFDAQEVEQLARHGRPRGGDSSIGRIEVAIGTSITGIVDEQLYYRGYKVTSLASQVSFERTIELLWSGSLPFGALVTCDEKFLLPAIRACNALPVSSPAIERFAVACGALACGNPLRVDLRIERVREHGHLLLCAFASVLPTIGRERPRHSRSGRQPNAFASRLWPHLSSVPTNAARSSLLNAALVLFADHELATSTMAARVAASTRADPYGVVLAGLGALSGPLHGKAALAVHRLLLDAEHAPSPQHAVAAVLGQAQSVPGFGHPVYKSGDPRALHLLSLLRDHAPRMQRQVIEEVLRAAETKQHTAVINADYALGALAYAYGMPLGSTEAIFAIARTAGWIAHALEEYGERPLRFRARAIYDGSLSAGPM